MERNDCQLDPSLLALIAALPKKDNSSEYTAPEISNSVYKDKAYWENRFTEEVEYDWLVNFAQLKDHLLPHLQPTDRILIVGCGNSSFSSGLYNAGFENITNIDFSETVIQNMASLHKDLTNMKWMCMDMTSMSFPSQSFDVVIDKAAMDALMVVETDVWHPEQSVMNSANSMCQCVSDCLKSQGIFIQISFAQPHFRTKYLKGLRTDAENPDPNMNYYATECGNCDLFGWELMPYQAIQPEVGTLEYFMYLTKKY